MNKSSDLQNPNNQTTDIGPWYREFWAWFIFAPLIVVVLACTITVSIAVILQDDIVIDNYYKEGKALNQNFGPDKQAKELNIKASLSLNTHNDTFTLTINQPVPPNIELRLTLSHPAHKEKDTTFTIAPLTQEQLKQSPLELTISLANSLSKSDDQRLFLGSRWYIRLSAFDTVTEREFWRIQNEADFSQNISVELN